jgi:hypothetical protein
MQEGNTGRKKGVEVKGGRKGDGMGRPMRVFFNPRIKFQGTSHGAPLSRFIFDGPSLASFSLSLLRSRALSLSLL